MEGKGSEWVMINGEGVRYGVGLFWVGVVGDVRGGNVNKSDCLVLCCFFF